MKKKNNIKFLVLVFTIFFCLLLVIFLRPFYRVNDRVEKLESYSSEHDSSEPLGWLMVQGTNIDFPIFYYDDLEDATDPTFDLGWNYNNKKDANRLVILSHNVLNVSSKPLIANKDHRRFEQLMSFIYYDFVKNNKYIQYATKGKNYLYKIYAISIQKEDTLNLDNISKKEIVKYSSDMKDKSYFKFNVDVNKNDKLITLVTCTRFFENKEYSFVVDARRVRKGEYIHNYSTKKTVKYNNIEKKLKGDDTNE